MAKSGILVGVQIPEIPQQIPVPKVPTEPEKTTKKSPKILSPKEQVIPRAKSKIAQPLSLSPESFAAYKPPPIESQIGGHAKQVQHFKPPQFLEERNSLKEDVNRLNSALDEVVASLVPKTPLNEMEKYDLMQKLVRVHDYTMNELILIDKPICSDRALLLHRLHTFYQEVIDDFPNYFQTYKNTINELQKNLAETTTRSEEYFNKMKQDEETIATLNKEKEDLEEEKKQITQESNDKDNEIQFLKDKIEILERNNQNLQFKIKTLKEKKTRVKQLYHNVCEDEKQQFEMIENLTKQLKVFEDGDSAIVWDLRKSQIRVSELEEQNTKLCRSIYLLEHKEMFDACVDTSDLPALEKKKKKKKSPEPFPKAEITPMPISQQTSQSILLGSSDSLTKINSSQTFGNIPSCPSQSRISVAKSIGKLPTFPSQNRFMISPEISSGSINTRQNNECAMKRIVSVKTKETQTEEITFLTTESQTDDVTIVNHSVTNENETKNDSQENENTQQDLSSFIEEKEEDEVIFDIETIQFSKVLNYTLDEEKLHALPDLFHTLVPIFGSQYKSPNLKDLEKLNIGHLTGVKKQDRTLVWALQLIHNFLCDPFIRSYEASELDSTENIFVEWLVRQYKLAHIVNQICADLSIIIYTVRDDEKMIKFFSNMMENRFSYAQMCFVSLLYSFSVDFTFPSILTLLQDPELDSSHDSIQIHMKSCFYVLSKCISPILATSFLKQKIVETEPLWGFFDFLVQSTVYFNDKHKQLFYRTNEILTLCGQLPQHHFLTYDVFNKFMCLLYNVKDHKKWWDKLLIEKNDSGVDSIGLIKICAEKKKPLLELLRRDKISGLLSQYLKAKPIIQEFYQHFLLRFSETVPQVLQKVPAVLEAKLNEIVESFRNDLLNLDFHAILWHYRQFLNVIDTDMLNIVREIPFIIGANDEVYGSIIDFFNMTEKISFSLIE